MIGWLQNAYEPISRSLPLNPVDLQKLFVCVGPGSYVGMRENVSFAKAIEGLHKKQPGKSFKMEIIPFTIFDLFLLLAKQHLLNKQIKSGKLLIKAWPRNKITAETPTNKIRVYIDDFTKQGQNYILAHNHQLINLTDVKTNPALHFITNLSQTITERLSIKKDFLLPVSLTIDLQKKLIPQLTPAHYDLEPLYINPPSYESTNRS